MTKKAQENPAEIIAETFQSNRGQEVVILDLRKTGQNVCDYFIICHGTSKVQTQSIAENSMQDVRKKLKIKPFSVEGMKNGEWILLDYGDIVAHIFLDDSRQFFHLEDLWADAKIIRKTKEESKDAKQ
jgi:ribosome-associated protein